MTVPIVFPDGASCFPWRCPLFSLTVPIVFSDAVPIVCFHGDHCFFFLTGPIVFSDGAHHFLWRCPSPSLTEWGFRLISVHMYICHRLNWARSTSWGYRDESETELEIWVLLVCSRPCYLSVTEAFHNAESFQVRKNEAFVWLQIAHCFFKLPIVLSDGVRFFL